MSRVLVIGAYLADRPNTHAHLAHEFAASEEHDVVQRWATVGTGRRPRAALSVLETPKFVLMNRLLALEPIDDFDVIVCSDDDITLPDGFLDDYLAAQAELGFALAQPARTRESQFWHEITRQQPDTLARETRFVEIGPLFSVTRDAFEHVLPFDETSRWGFGYEFVWARLFRDAGLRMGVIDAFPVEHTLRPHSSFDHSQARRDMERLLDERDHLERADCLVTLDAYPLEPVGAGATNGGIA